VFRDEARDLDPGYRPETVNTDGWAATQAAWQALFRGVTLILCFLHAFLKIRDRAVHMKEGFTSLRERVWEAYHAPDARSFSQRLRRLREWAEAHVEKEVVREKVLALCGKRGRSSGRTSTRAATGRVTWRTDCCGDSITTCIAANTSTARWRPPSVGSGAGR
jgi:hypothetical protein